MKKSDITKALDKLPRSIFDKAYAIDFMEIDQKLCTPRVQINYDIDVEREYTKRPIVRPNEFNKDFAEYHINGWRVVMETNKGDYCPECGEAMDDNAYCRHPFHGRG